MEDLTRIQEQINRAIEAIARSTKPVQEHKSDKSIRISGGRMEKRLLNVKEAAEYLATTKATVYTYASRGQIPANCIRRIGRALKFEKAALDAWISAQNGGKATPGVSR